MAVRFYQLVVDARDPRSIPVAEDKTVKNRLHIDLDPDDRDVLRRHQSLIS